MPKGQTTRLHVSLTDDERRILEAWQRALKIPAWRARRGRIILLLADGMSITQIAATVPISRRFVYKWAARFAESGVAGLADLPHGRYAHRPLKETPS